MTDVEDRGAWSGRFAPPRSGGAGGGRVSPAAGRSGPTGGVPSYMRGTASHAGITGGGRVSPAAGSRPTISPAAGSGRDTPGSARPGFGGGGGGGGGGASPASRPTGRTPAGAGKAEAKTLAGKPLFSALPENAGRAEFISNIEATITEAATAKVSTCGWMGGAMPRRGRASLATGGVTHTDTPVPPVYR